MKGAVAAGHPLTAQAGADILEAGGNAVDACLGAGFVSWVTESPLTGPGAGGFLLVHRASDRSDRLLDFFVAIPGLGLAIDPGTEMLAVEVPFDAENIQIFRIGAASCGVPGAVAGFGEAHRLYGRMPWPELLAPAIELARRGVTLLPAQAFLHEILDVALRASPDARCIYGEERALAEGETLVMRDLADTLELLAEEGADAFYRGELASRISAFVREGGGRLTEDDLAAYRVVRRRPVRARFRGAEFVSNPPPSSGGILIGFALRVLDELGPDEEGSSEALARLAGAMRETTRARAERFASRLHRGGLAERLLAPERVSAAVTELRAPSRPARIYERAGPRSTTHVSVVDASGNAASLSASTGCGSGVVVPGTGVHVNNMLGEADLNPGDRAVVPGRRLTSMMAPSLVLESGKPRLVVGSAGSNRLRDAVLQIVVNVIGHGLGVAEAIAAPRIHFDGSRLHLEGGVPADAAAALAEHGFDVVPWSEQNLFFGGASAVTLAPDGMLEAAGDPRRGGTGVVVR